MTVELRPIPDPDERFDELEQRLVALEERYRWRTPEQIAIDLIADRLVALEKTMKMLERTVAPLARAAEIDHARVMASIDWDGELEAAALALGINL
jgi:hypothetical protein